MDAGTSLDEQRWAWWCRLTKLSFLYEVRPQGCFVAYLNGTLEIEPSLISVYLVGARVTLILSQLARPMHVVLVLAA